MCGVNKHILCVCVCPCVHVHRKGIGFTLTRLLTTVIRGVQSGIGGEISLLVYILLYRLLTVSLYSCVTGQLTL